MHGMLYKLPVAYIQDYKNEKRLVEWSIQSVRVDSIQNITRLGSIQTKGLVGLFFKSSLTNSYIFLCDPS